MSKGVIQPDGTFCYSGPNCRKHGLKAQLWNAVNVTPSIALSKKAPVNKVFPPVRRPENPLKAPYLDEETHLYGVDTEYDAYYCQGTDGEDDYCRDSIYEGLRVESVDGQRVLRQIFGAEYGVDNLPQNLLDFADDIGINDISSYEAEAVWGYYGQEAEVHLEASKIAELKAWYWSLDNAEDKDGILGYVRSKGLDTFGFTPIEAIKEQLAKENGGAKNTKVDSATKVSTKKIALSQIIIPNPTHLEEVEAQSATPAARSIPVTGVVRKEGKKYVLVDGYHRIKGLHGAKGPHEFIVLE